ACAPHRPDGRFFDTAGQNWKRKDRRTANLPVFLSANGHYAIASRGPGLIYRFRSTSMLKTLPRMKLSPEEETFMRHWIYDEAHFREGRGPAKTAQVAHGAISADLATIIAAALPDPLEQEEAGNGPPPAQAPEWPWTDETLRSRLVEARRVLTEREQG